MNALLISWQLWALLSAGFAALTAIFAKVGIQNVNSDFATLIRTVVILLVVGSIVAGSGQWQPLRSVAARTYLFLGLSGLATGASWLCYFRALQLGDAALVAPIDKLSVVLVALFAVAFLGERLSAPNWLGDRPHRRRRGPGRVPRIGRVVFRYALAGAPGWLPARCGMTTMQAMMKTAITAEASGRLSASPPLLTGLSRKSPTVAPSGRVRMKAAQNSSTREISVQT